MTMLLALIAVVGPFAVALLVRTFLPGTEAGHRSRAPPRARKRRIAGWLVGFLLGWAITPDAPTVPWLAGGAVVGAALLTWLVGRAVSKRRAAAQQGVR